VAAVGYEKSFLKISQAKEEKKKDFSCKPSLAEETSQTLSTATYVSR